MGDDNTIDIDEAIKKMYRMKQNCERGEDWELYLSMETTLELLKELGFDRITLNKERDYE